MSKAVTPALKNYLSLQSLNEGVDEGINIVGAINPVEEL